MNIGRVVRQMVFAQVLLGLMIFCLADRNPGLLLITGALAALSWHLVEGPVGRSLGQGWILAGSLGVVGWLLAGLWMGSGDDALGMAGRFTLWIQVLHLYARKSNRDYALLMSLSLLQVAGAMVLHPSLGLGLLAAGYGWVMLVNLLLLQMKISAEQVARRSGATVTRGAVEPAAGVRGAGHRGQFRMMAAGVGLMCGAVGLVVFVLLPRGAGGSSIPMPGARIAFSPTVRLGGPAPSGGSSTPVLNLVVRMHGLDAGMAGRKWLLRAAVMDYYSAPVRTWVRSNLAASGDVQVPLPAAGVELAEAGQGVVPIEAEVTLRDRGHELLFTLHPLTRLSSPSVPGVVFGTLDQRVGVRSGGGVPRYKMTAALTGSAGMFESYRDVARRTATRQDEADEADAAAPGPMEMPAGYARGWAVETARVRALALEVLEKAGVETVAGRVDAEAAPAAAKALCDHLQRHYRYSLNTGDSWDRSDPVVRFLLEEREGHCELFASGLAAMARSVGMRARVVSGYLAHDYNAIGGYYTVRENDAHAWTEIDCGRWGWTTLDATPAGAVRSVGEAAAGWTARWRQLYEHLEFTWLDHFVAFDRQLQRSLGAEISGWMTGALPPAKRSDAGEEFAEAGGGWPAWAQARQRWLAAAALAGGLVVAWWARRSGGLGRWWAGIGGWRWRWPAGARAGGSRGEEAAFYWAMVRMLERHGHRRPEWQTPMAFADTVAGTDRAGLAGVVDLTRCFYAVRFGGRLLGEADREKVKATLEEVGLALARRVGR